MSLDSKKQTVKKSSGLHEEDALSEPKYDIAELVSRITPENKHEFSEADFGEPVGRERL